MIYLLKKQESEVWVSMEGITLVLLVNTNNHSLTCKYSQSYQAGTNMQGFRDYIQLHHVHDVNLVLDQNLQVCMVLLSVSVLSHSVVSNSYNPIDYSCSPEAPLSMGFSSQEY